MHATDKIFGKICLKAIRDTFFPNMWPEITGGTGVDMKQRGSLF